MKNLSSKLWEVKSKSCEDIFWIRAKTKPEAKKILREYLRSPEYWKQEITEDNLEFSGKLYKSYNYYKEIPGIFVDDTRGDLIIDLTEPGNDYIRKEEST